jgi:hypothetical protein
MENQAIEIEFNTSGKLAAKFLTCKNDKPRCGPGGVHWLSIKSCFSSVSRRGW